MDQNPLPSEKFTLCSGCHIEKW